MSESTGLQHIFFLRNTKSEASSVFHRGTRLFKKEHQMMAFIILCLKAFLDVESSPHSTKFFSLLFVDTCLNYYLFHLRPTHY